MGMPRERYRRPARALLTHFRGQEVVNAVMLRSIIEARRVRAPPALLASFGEVMAPYAEPA